MADTRVLLSDVLEELLGDKSPELKDQAEAIFEALSTEPCPDDRTLVCVLALVLDRLFERTYSKHPARWAELELLFKRAVACWAKDGKQSAVHGVRWWEHVTWCGRTMPAGAFVGTMRTHGPVYCRACLRTVAAMLRRADRACR